MGKSTFNEPPRAPNQPRGTLSPHHRPVFLFKRTLLPPFCPTFMQCRSSMEGDLGKHTDVWMKEKAEDGRRSSHYFDLIVLFYVLNEETTHAMKARIGCSCGRLTGSTVPRCDGVPRICLPPKPWPGRDRTRRRRRRTNKKREGQTLTEKRPALAKTLSRRVMNRTKTTRGLSQLRPVTPSATGQAKATRIPGRNPE